MRSQASYAVLAVFTRELTIINMWAGQLLCEVFSWILKRAIKQERPSGRVQCVCVVRTASYRISGSVGTGYGFPSSHSQYMAYFATFLVLHLHFRHRFISTGSWIIDQSFRLLLHAAFIGWAGTVAYSRQVALPDSCRSKLIDAQALSTVSLHCSSYVGTINRRCICSRLLRGDRTHPH